MILWFLYLFVISSDTTICLCKDKECFGSCAMEQDSIIDTKEAKDEIQFYNSLTKALGRHKAITIYIIGIDTDFGIDLSFLRNRNIAISSVTGMKKPKNLIFYYSNEQDYSETSLELRGMNFIFSNKEKNAGEISLKFKRFYFISDGENSLEFQPDSSKYSIITESIDLPLQIYKIFTTISCIGDNVRVSIRINETEMTSISIYEKECYINNSKTSINVSFASIKALEVVGTVGIDSSVQLIIMNETEKCPFVKIIDILDMRFDGDWTKALIANFDKPGEITSSMAQYSPRITLNTPLFPFILNSYTIEFHLECSVEIHSELTSNIITLHTLPNLGYTRLNVSILNVINSRVSLFSANLNVRIENYLVGGDLTDILPFEIAISDYTISLFTVKYVTYIIGNPISYYLHLHVRSFVSSDKNDDYFNFIYSLNPIIQIPTLMSYYILLGFSILYTDDSAKFYGLQNECNFLTINGMELNEVDYLINFFGSIPSATARILCYGSECLNPFNQVSDLSNNLGNYFIDSVTSYQIILEVPFNDESELTINLNDVLITEYSLIITDNYGYKVNLVFSETKGIKTLSLSSTNVRSINNIYAKKVSFTNIICNNMDNKFSMNCDILELDIASVAILGQVNGEITSIIVSDVQKIDFNNNLVYVNSQNINSAFLPNCSFISINFLTFNILNSNEISGFKVVMSDDSAITYQGDWSLTTITKDINIILNGNRCDITLKSNYIHEKIHYIDGETFYNYDYEGRIDICVYLEDQSPCSTFINKEKYSDFDPTLINNKRIDIYLTGFTTESFEIDLFLFNKKQVTFNRVTNAQKMNIELSNSIDCDLTVFTFNNVEVQPKTATEMEFGCIESTNSVFEGFSTVDIKVNVMKCSFENLASFKSVYVKSELIVSGNLVISGSSVFFAEHTSLQLFINDQCKIIYKSLGIKIGESTFTFLSSKSMVKIYHLSDKRIEIVGETLENAMKTEIFIAIDTRIDFSGTWSLDNKIFEIISTSPFSIGLGCNAPIDIKSTHIVNIEALTDNCGIIGSVNNVITVSTLNNIETQVSLEELTIETFQSMEIFLIHVSSPNINLIVSRIKSMLQFGPQINFVFAFDENRIATLKVIEPFPINIVLADQPIYIESLVYGELKNNDEYPILQSSFVFLDVVRLLNVFLINPIYKNNDSNLTHGFNQFASVFSITINMAMERTQLSIYASLPPSQIPYMVQYAEMASIGGGNVIVNENDLENMFNSLSEKITKITIIISKNMNADYPLPFSFFNNWGNNINIMISGINGEIYIDQFASCIKSLTISNTKVIFKKNVIFENMESLSLNKVEFNNIELKQNKELITDMKSYKKLLDNIPDLSTKFRSFHFINSNYITFTDDGWIFQEEVYEPMIRLRKEDVEKVQVECIDFLVLNIEKPRIQAKVHGIEVILEMSPVQWYLNIIFGPGWSGIKEYDNLIITSNNPFAYFMAISNDYPFPPVFRSQLVSSNLNIYSNSEIWIADAYEPHYPLGFMLNHLPIEKAIVHCNHLILNSIYPYNEIGQRDNYGIFEIKYLEARENSYSLLYSCEITQKLEMFLGSRIDSYFSISINKANIIMHWVNDTFPSIFFRGFKDSLGTPNNVDIILDDEAVDYETYHNYIYRKSFTIFTGDLNCFDWLGKIHFISNDKFFNDSSDLVFTTQCTRNLILNNFALNIFGSKQLPIPTNDEMGIINKPVLTNNTVIYISAAVIVFVVIILGVLVYYVTKYQYEKLMSKKNSYTFSTASNDQNNVESFPDNNIENSNENIDESYQEEESSLEEDKSSTDGYNKLDEENQDQKAEPYIL